MFVASSLNHFWFLISDIKASSGRCCRQSRMWPQCARWCSRLNSSKEKLSRHLTGLIQHSASIAKHTVWLKWPSLWWQGAQGMSCPFLFSLSLSENFRLVGKAPVRKLCEVVFDWDAEFSVHVDYLEDLPSHVTSSPSLLTFNQRLKCTYFV